LPPLEASGTSGMEAALNGVLNFSVLDGWWLEGCVESRTGWAIGDDGEVGEHGGAAHDLYDKRASACRATTATGRARSGW
jgi:glycogen phosphorylase